jgi:sugar lactone lactonase YvrE
LKALSSTSVDARAPKILRSDIGVSSFQSWFSMKRARPWHALLSLLISAGACTGLTVNPEGRPCDDKNPCGPGTVCDPATRTCVKEQAPRDARVKDSPLSPDLALPADAPGPDRSPLDLVAGDLSPDSYVPDTVPPDSYVVPDAGCPTGFTQCGNECANLQISFEHCGACNSACSTATANLCVAGKCVCGSVGGLCPSGLNCIGGVCICVKGGRCGGCCEDSSTCLPVGSPQSATACGNSGEPCKVCYDYDTCTQDSCSSAGVCQQTPRADGTSCNDWDGCTTSDACLGGVCTGTPIGGPCVTTVAGEGSSGYEDGFAVLSRLNSPNDVAVDASGKIYVADQNNHRIRLVDGTTLSTFAGTGQAGFADGAALTTARFDVPYGVAVDSGGAVYVADRDNNRIRKIAGGQVTTFAGTGTAGLQNGAAAQAQLDHPCGLTVDAAGVVYVADRGNNVVRKIAGGQVTTLAGSGTAGLLDGAAAQAQFDAPYTVAVDSSGAVYVADLFNHRIRKIAGGQVTTIAGSGTGPGFADGPAGSSQLAYPVGLAVDSAGTVYFASNERVRAISAGAVSTLAGTGTAGWQDGAAAQAQFNSPHGLALGAGGSIYVADRSNHRIRMILP